MQFTPAIFITTLNKSLCVGLFALMAGSSLAAKPVPYYYMGEPEKKNVSASPVSCAQENGCTPSVALVGGGYDVGEAFRWMINRAGITPSTGGRFVIIRATGSDAYNPYIYSNLGEIDHTTTRNHEMVGGITLGVTSVETLIISSRTAAGDSSVLAKVARANAIFIAGGNQADYQNYWAGTPLAAALQNAVTRGIPVGGTSAGAAVLGEYAFVALGGSVTSSDALLDPFDRDVTINPLNTATKKTPDPTSLVTIPTLANVITDSHLNKRDRLGRMFSFVSRIEHGCTGGKETPATVIGIGLGEETALLVSGPVGNVKAELAANPYHSENTIQPYTPRNSVYLAKYTTTPTQCVAGKPLTAPTSVQLYRLSAQTSQLSPYPTAPNYSFKSQATFNLRNWGSQILTTFDDNSSLNGPFTFGADNGAVLGNKPY